MPYVNIRITREGATSEQKRQLIRGATDLLVGRASWWKYRSPREADATAATRAIPAAAVNTVTSPWWNGSVISRGKNSVAEERREQGADRWQGGDGIGRRGGDAVRRQAGGQGVRQRVGEPGDHQGEEHADRQRRPEFWNVERMPEATPRWCSGTLLMIADVLGAEKTPWPIPLSTSRPAKVG